MLEVKGQGHCDITSAPSLWRKNLLKCQLWPKVELNLVARSQRSRWLLYLVLSPSIYVWSIRIHHKLVADNELNCTMWQSHLSIFILYIMSLDRNGCWRTKAYNLEVVIQVICMWCWHYATIHMLLKQFVFYLIYLLKCQWPVSQKYFTYGIWCTEVREKLLHKTNNNKNEQNSTVKLHVTLFILPTHDIEVIILLCASCVSPSVCQCEVAMFRGLPYLSKQQELCLP